LLHRELVERRPHVDGGGVDEDVRRAERRGDRRGAVLDRGALSEVGGVPRGPAACRDDGSCGGVERLARSRDEHHRGAGLGQRVCDGPADARVPARDDGHAAVQGKEVFQLHAHAVIRARSEARIVMRSAARCRAHARIAAPVGVSRALH
jgi:hypothetical protein